MLSRRYGILTPKTLMRKALPTLLIVAFALSGCATVGAGEKVVFDGGSKGERKFKDMSDEEALKITVAVYNVTPETEEDIKAKNIAMGAYVAELKKRKSKYLDDSGVFKLAYEEIDLKKWSDQDIVTMFRTLEARASSYGRVEVNKLEEGPKALMLMRLTAMNAVFEEGKRRDLFRNMVDVAMNAFLVFASVAVAII
jgi:predicted small secreted protein